jgi:hypothetical protein
MFKGAWASSPISLMEAQASIRVDTSHRAFARLEAIVRPEAMGLITSPFALRLFLIEYITKKAAGIAGGHHLVPFVMPGLAPESTSFLVK